MTYSSGQTAVSSNPASALMTAIDAIIVQHPNWTFVEQVTTTTTAGVARIYKCSGAGNNYGTDFYFSMWYSNATLTTLAFNVMEIWTPSPTATGVHVAINGGSYLTAPSNGGAGFVTDNTARTADALAGSTNFTGLSTTAAINYGVVVTKSRIVVAIGTGGVNGSGYIGGLYVMNPRQAAAFNTLFPLFSASAVNTYLVSGQGQSGASARMSRSANSGGQLNHSLVAAASTMCGQLYAGAPVVDALEGVIRPVGVLVAATGGTSAQVNFGSQRGSLPGLYTFYTPSGGSSAANDLFILADGTRLMGVGIGNVLQLTVDVDADV